MYAYMYVHIICRYLFINCIHSCVHVYHLEGCTVASGVHMYHMKLRMCIMHTHPDTTFVPHV